MIIILLISSFILGYFGIKFPIYIAYAYIIISLLLKNYKNKTNILFQVEDLLDIYIYSFILPDNYTTILIISIIWLLLSLNKVNRTQIISYLKNKYFIIGLLIIFITSIINGLSIVKLLFFVLYNITYLLLLSLLSYFRTHFDKFSGFSIKQSILAQFVAIISYILRNYEQISSQIDHDWITGTFGTYQSNILLFFCAFSMFYFIKEFIRSKNFKNLIYCFMAAGILLSTTSTALIILLIISILLVSLFYLKREYIKKGIIALLVTLTFAYIVTPSWIVNDVINMTNISYATQRISKLETYHDSFIKMQNEPIKYIFGVGLGNYSSRSALTCTGLYIESYNKLFKPEISYYTSSDVLYKYINVVINRLGSMDTPYSSIISIKSEFGLVGLVFLLICFYCSFRGKDYLQKIIILFFFFSLFIENYIEFAKVINYLILIDFLLSIEDKSNVKEGKTMNNIKLKDFTFGLLMYNQENLILETLESIKHQINTYGEGRKIYLIATDDNSKDNTVIVFKKWIESNKHLFSDVTLVENEENKGTVVNFIKIIKLSKSNNIKVIAGDDLFSRDNYFEMYENLNNNTIGTSFPLLLLDEKITYDEKMLRRYYWKLNFKNDNSEQIFNIVKGGYINTPSTFYTKELFIKSKCENYINQFNLFEDDPTYYSILNSNKANLISFFKKSTVLYRIHSLGTSTVNVNGIFYKDLIKFKMNYVNEEKNIFRKIYIFLKFKIKHRYLNPVLYYEKLQDLYLKLLFNKNKGYIEFKKLIDDYVIENQNYYDRIKREV